MSENNKNLADIKDLSVSFMTDAGSIKAVEDVNFTIPRKTVVGVVGESGSGKSVTARSIIKLLPETATTSGAVYLSKRDGSDSLDVLSLSGEQLREVRGSEAAMVFQEPNSVLNPVYTIGWQIEEGLRAHGMKDKKELRAKAINILKKVGIPDAETRVDYYPHQFSGGQKQRIVIAMALVLNPGLILADEPTTALDVTVQAEILDLLRLARDEFDASVLIITHNMGVIADIADQVVVMYRGHVVEQGDVEQIFYHPKDDYTKRLLGAVPRIGQKLVVRDREGKPIERKADWREQPIAVEAKNLTITYPGHLMQPDFKAVDGANFTIHRSEVLGLVGESGSGKSVTARSLIKLLPETATTSGAVYLSNRAGTEELEVLSLSGEQLREMRGAEAAMVFQEPNSVLNPVYTIGWQIEEGLRAHGMKDKKELRAKSIDILKKVGIPDAETRIDYYPHQFSGGQKQRIVIAMALVLNPGLILADEPTTALDVTVQAEILDLLRLARDEFDASVLIITHNMGVIADIADEVVVMYRGHVVEQGSVEQIFYSPKDDYTKRLLAAVPRIGQKLVVKDADGKVIEREKDWRDQPIAVEAKGLTITYPGHLMQPDFKAVDGIDFTIHRSEVLGLVGESGSGKSTTGRAIAGLQKVSGGSLNVLGIEMNGVKERDFKPKRADIGFVFQDPGSSFNPLMTIAENVAEPLIVHKKFSSVSDARKYVGDLLEMVQLPRAYMNRFPHELSGGQRQRASLARALALKPSLLIADEPTSALDVSVQAKVLELFKKLQAEIGFACLFITHDLAVVDMLADRIMVMHKGQIVEHGDADQIMQNPQNPYTQKLLASLPVPDPREQRKHREHLHELLAAQQ